MFHEKFLKVKVIIIIKMGKNYTNSIHIYFLDLFILCFTQLN